MSTMEEKIDITDEQGNFLGYSEPRSTVHREGLWHRVVHVWLVDSNGMLLIQKRSSNKESFPDYWDISSAGHIEAGMDSKDTAVKELCEELGILHSVNDLEYLFSVNKRAIQRGGKYIDNEIGDVYLITYTHPFDLTKVKLQTEEVSDVKLIYHKDLLNLIRNQDNSIQNNQNSIVNGGNSSDKFKFVPLFDSSKEPIESSKYYQMFSLLNSRYPNKPIIDSNHWILP